MKFSSHAIVFFLTTVMSASSPHGVVVDATPGRIVGGDPSDQGEWPYYTLINGCGGSLIAPRVILTAAHCKPQKDINKKVIIGPTKRKDLDNGPFQMAEKRRIKKAIPHPNYKKKTLANDYALILLDKEYIIESTIKLVLNEDPNFPPAAGEVLDVLGMGTLSSGGDVADVLMDVKVESFSNSQCNSYFGGNPMKDSMICAGLEEGGKDSCQGDSGGPLVKVIGNTHTQVGISSWGYGCADEKSPGVYSRVSEEINWMKKVICDEWNVEFYLCGQTPPTPPAPTPAPIMSPTPPTPLSFEKLGKGYPRDSKGKFNKNNWDTKNHCVDFTACQDKCKAQDQCVGIAWASTPKVADDTGCRAQSLPRCVVYYGVTAQTVAVEEASGDPKEFRAYRYGAPVDPTVCADSESFKWKGVTKKNCTWVANQKENENNNVCKKWAKKTGIKKVKDFCKKTCGKC